MTSRLNGAQRLRDSRLLRFADWAVIAGRGRFKAARSTLQSCRLPLCLKLNLIRRCTVTAFLVPEIASGGICAGVAGHVSGGCQIFTIIK